MGEEILSRAWEYGFALVGSVATIIVLGTVVRVLWREQQQVDRERISDLKHQFEDRLKDKNAELSQVWGELRSERDEKRREQAAKEGLERLLQRQMELTRSALEDGAAWRKLSGRS